MDDMKKAAYIRARELRETGESDFVCIALQDALGEILGEAVPFSDTQEMFPEFTNLFDGSFWNSYGEKHNKNFPNNVWWQKGWKGPRLRIIDMIMSQE